MWLTLLLGLANFALGWLGTYVVRLPGFDLTPIGVIIIAQQGEPVLLGATVMTVSYMLVKPSRFSWIWLQLPSALLIGYLALIIPWPVLLITLYHVISITFGIIFGIFDGKYGIYTFVNVGINLAVARLYGA